MYKAPWLLDFTLTNSSMAKQQFSQYSFSSILHKRWLLRLFILLSLIAAFAFIIRAAFDSSTHCAQLQPDQRFHSAAPLGPALNPLGFIKSKLVLLVSHELSLSGIETFTFSLLEFDALFAIVLNKLLYVWLQGKWSCPRLIPQFYCIACLSYQADYSFINWWLHFGRIYKNENEIESDWTVSCDIF